MEDVLAFRHLDYAVTDRVAEITMRRAPVNAIDHALIEDINDAYRRAKVDPGVRAVILTSAFERSFSAGMDLAMIRGKRGLDLGLAPQDLVDLLEASIAPIGR